jgi:hypothetical protein
MSGPIASYAAGRSEMSVPQLRASGLYFAIVPAGTRDEYAAGYDGNAFATEEEAEAAIPGLVAAFGEGSELDWRVIQRAFAPAEV